MSEDDRGSELRDALARPDAAVADGERNADDVAETARRRPEIEAALERLGAGSMPGGDRATTCHEAP